MNECNHCYFTSKHTSKMKGYFVKEHGSSGEFLHMKMGRGKVDHIVVNKYTASDI